MAEILLTGLAAMIVYLDTSAIAQFMICQPLIACPAFGLLLGRPELGVFFGVGFQLLWLGSLPVGAAKFPEGNVGAIVATSVAASVPPLQSGDPAWIVIAIGVLAGFLVAYVGADVTILVRKLLGGYAPLVVDAAATHKLGKFRLLILGAVGLHATAGFLLGITGLLAGRWLLHLYTGSFFAAGVSNSIAEATDWLLSGTWPALLGCGAAVVFLRFMPARKRIWIAPAAIIGAAWALLR